MTFNYTPEELELITEVVTSVGGYGGITVDEAMHLYTFSKHAAKLQHDILETGTWTGSSSIVLALGLKDSDARLFTLDINPVVPEGVFAKYSVDSRIHSIKCNSIEYTPEVSCFGFIFLDSDHSYSTAKNEIDKYSPLLVSGGIIAGHDYATIPTVARAFDEFFASGQFDVGRCGKTAEQVDGNIIYGIKK